MSYEIDGVEYLNGKESAAYLDVSYTTFLQMEKLHNLECFSIPGKGRNRFFKKSDLERLRQPRSSKG